MCLSVSVCVCLCACLSVCVCLCVGVAVWSTRPPCKQTKAIKATAATATRTFTTTTNILQNKMATLPARSAILYYYFCQLPPAHTHTHKQPQCAQRVLATFLILFGPFICFCFCFILFCFFFPFIFIYILHIFFVVLS